MCAAPGTCSEGEAHDGLRAYPCRVPSARRTSSTPTAWVSCCTMARCPRCGFRRANCATSASCRAPGPSQAGRTVAFSKIRTALKNRMHATFATPALAGGAREYGLSLDTLSDIYAAKWRAELTRVIGRLPEETRRCMEQELELLDLVQGQIDRLEARILERVRITPTIQLVMSLPGPAEILSIVIDREVGSIERFSCPKHFCGYAGTVPKVKGSGGKFHYGRMIKQCNNYLKWAFIACPGGLGQGGGECGGSAATSPELAEEVRRPALRANPPTKGPLGRGGRRGKVSGGSDLLGVEERRALSGAELQATDKGTLNHSAQAGPGPSR